MREKLLMLCYRAPYPIKSGSEIRMYQFIEILSEVYDITLLYLDERACGEQTAEEKVLMHPLYEKCRDVKAFSVGKMKRYVQAMAGYLFAKQPLQLGYFYSGEMQSWINAHAGEYETVLCMHVRTVQYMLRIEKKKREKTHLYLDGIDAITLNYYNSYQTSKGLRKLVNYMEYRRMAVYEKKVYSEVGDSILISERDKEYIVDTLGVKCKPSVIYNYAIDFGYQPELEKDECTLAFMGKMDYAPNVDAVLGFVKGVYGKLKKRYPKLQFNIIGGNATSEIKKLGQMDGIHICGFVDNPAKLLQQATVVIAPMISGSGLQNKIVQAMYLGCTVLTTPVGADGLKEVTENELLIAGTNEDIYAALEHILERNAAEERKYLGQNARAYISRNYSYEKIKKDVMELFIGKNKAGFTR